MAANPPDLDHAPAGGEGGAPSSDPVELKVIDAARKAAPEAMGAVVELTKNPKRGGGTVLAAALAVLDVAGVRRATEDQRMLAQLQRMRKRLSPAAYAEVLGFYAEEAGVDLGSDKS